MKTLKLLADIIAAVITAFDILYLDYPYTSVVAEGCNCLSYTNVATKLYYTCQADLINLADLYSFCCCFY